MKSTCKTAKNTFRDIDQFGHPIQLNFNKKGNTHNTLVGASVTLFVLVFLGAYFYIHMERMINHGGDNISSYDKTIKFEDEPIVKWNEMNIHFSFVLIDGQRMRSKKYNDEAKRYLTVEFQQTEWDFKAKPPVFPNRKSRGVKKCTEKDMRTNMLRGLFAEW